MVKISCAVDSRCFIFGYLKENGNKNYFLSFERDSKRYVEIYYNFLYLFDCGGYSHLNRRTVRHLGVIFNLFNSVLGTSQ